MKKTLALLQEYNQRHRTPFARIRLYYDGSGRVEKLLNLFDSDVVFLFHFNSVKELKKKLKK